MAVIEFQVFGSAVSQRERSFVAGGRMGRYVTKETHNWRSIIRAQAVEHKPEALPLGAIRLAVEMVLPRPGYLMAPKYFWRCKARKCGWKGSADDLNRIWLEGTAKYVTEDGIVAVPCPSCARILTAGLHTPPHTVRPDWENCWKPVVDALTGLFWRDDAQIIGPSREGPCGKRWAEIGEAPCVKIRIMEVQE